MRISSPPPPGIPSPSRRTRNRRCAPRPGLAGPATPPSLRVYRVDPQDNHRVSVVAEKAGGGWTLSTVEEKDGKITSRKDRLRPDRAANLDRIVTGACFYTEPTELSSETAEAKCLGAMDLYVEAVNGASAARPSSIARPRPRPERSPRSCGNRRTSIEAASRIN